MSKLTQFASQVALNCYDNETQESVGVQESAASVQVATGTPVVVSDTKLFTQDDVNKFLAADRRKVEASVTVKMKEQLEKTAHEYAELSKRASLTEQERAEYLAKYEATDNELKTYMSEKERLLKEKEAITKTLSTELTAVKKRAEDWEGRYKNTEIQRTLLNVAQQNDAWAPAQLVEMLLTKTEINDDMAMTVSFQDIVDGKPVATKLPPDEAVRRMRELPDMYGNLFKAAKVGGAGGTNTGTTKIPHGGSRTQEEHRVYRKSLGM